MLRFDEFPFWETRPYLQVRKNVMLVLLGRLNIIIFGCFQKMGTYTPKKRMVKINENHGENPMNPWMIFLGVLYNPVINHGNFFQVFNRHGSPRVAPQHPLSPSRYRILALGAVLSLHNATHYWSRPTKCPVVQNPTYFGWYFPGISWFTFVPYLVRIIPRTST